MRIARPIVDHLIDVHARAHDLRTPGGQARFVDAVLPIIRNLPNPVLRDAYLQRIRQVSGVEERTLLEAMHRRQLRDADPRTAWKRFSAAAVVARRRRAAGQRHPAWRSRARSRSCRGSYCSSPRHARRRPRRPRAGTACPSQVARALYRADRDRPRAAAKQGVRPPYVLTAILDGLDEESRAPARPWCRAPAPTCAS